ncbi:MAG: glycoside hydrolase family 3 C-terminal domain-containing protein [Ignavibacteriae bacterium]|nr:glycoside hydrolase family 3 C-terminal domain-containing protein [Ignavibacteriota bacterium]
MNKKKILLYTLFFLSVIWGFDVTRFAKKAEYDWVYDRMKSMTLREKIAQMVISSSESFSKDENSADFKRIKGLIESEKIGGLIFMRGNSLIEAELINKFQEFSETPLLISQDFERGTGMRLNDGSIFPNNMGIGATRNTELAYKMGLEIARECRALGVHQNYSPVMDVNNNPNNPIINVRSFGEDPQIVAELGNAMIKGLQDGGIIATAKHFPGHGDTDIDTHSDLPVIKFDRDRLNNIELVPFREAIKSGVKSVMTAHISFPAYDKTPNIPASLSNKIIGGLLSDELGFGGLKITDALNMAGVTKHFTTSQVAVMCVEAGIDLILMPQGEKTTIDAIEKAVLKGQISESRIDASVNKILEAKKWAGLNENKYTDLMKVSETINSEDAKKLSQLIADESITLVKNSGGNLPFGRRMGKKKESCLIVSLNNGNEKANSDFFLEKFSDRGSGLFTELHSYDIMGDVKNASAIIEDAKNYTYIVIPVYAKVKMKSGTVGLPSSQVELIKKLTENGNTVCVISFGNPYLLKGFREIDSYICAYGDCETVINATVKCMFGDVEFKGKLPVTISEEYKFGDGLKN